jgi:CheY-like chemotaxis protein
MSEKLRRNKYYDGTLRIASCYVAGGTDVQSQGDTAFQTDARPPVVLVVEDEVLIRLSITEYLQECGFKVLDASNASEAQSILEGGRSVDVLFTDVQMPGALDGFSLARWVKARFPDVRVILTSGVARMARDAADLCDHASFLPKPYDHRQLANEIQAALAQRDRAES